jgi:c-di-GMP-binding flagellar brake protein YcgR
VSCTFPVGVTVGRIRRRREFSLNLSATGMRITSGLPIELNARIALRFRLPMVARRAIEAEARVVHRTTHRNTWGRWEIGVFFFAIEEPDREIVGQEVIRLLTHSPH